MGVTSMPLRDHSLTVSLPFSVMISEAVPLGLEDPGFVIERFVREGREHRLICGIHALLSLHCWNMDGQT